nr:hypothetical protein HmN_000955000 [Hymenolepis microstoma]
MFYSYGTKDFKPAVDFKLQTTMTRLLCPTPSQSPPPSPRRGCGNDKPEVEAKTEGSGDASDKGKSNGV